MSAMSEMMMDLSRKQLEFEKRGLVKYDDKAITLDDGALPRYEIPLDRLQTAQDILSFVFHLRQKKWFTERHLSDFFYAIQMTVDNDVWHGKGD